MKARLEAVALQTTQATDALDQYRAAEEERNRAREEELANRLSTKAASIFEMGFDREVEQCSSREYLLPGVDTDLLDVEVALLQYPPEAFEL